MAIMKRPDAEAAPFRNTCNSTFLLNCEQQAKAGTKRPFRSNSICDGYQESNRDPAVRAVPADAGRLQTRAGQGSRRTAHCPGIGGQGHTGIGAHRTARSGHRGSFRHRADEVADCRAAYARGLHRRPERQDMRRLFNISCGSEGFFLERHPKLAPVNTFTDGIYLAGACQGPRDIPDTVAQAGAAAAEAMVLIDKGYIEQEPNTAYVLEEECSGCKSCIPLCPYTAITFDEVKEKATINEALCKGCGTCVASCPSGSIGQRLFEDEEVFSEIRGVLAA